MSKNLRVEEKGPKILSSNFRFILKQFIATCLGSILQNFATYQLHFHPQIFDTNFNPKTTYVGKYTYMSNIDNNMGF
jgi:Ni/Fe-hydrogenase subunit HybB-like protein